MNADEKLRKEIEDLETFAELLSDEKEIEDLETFAELLKGDLSRRGFKNENERRKS